MPLKDPLEKEITTNILLKKKICMKCYARNPPSATKCRRCQSKDLRMKRMKLRAKGV